MKTQNKKTAYSCQQCGSVQFKWAGKCPDCGTWNSLVEEYEEGGSPSYFSRTSQAHTSVLKSDAKKIELYDIDSDIRDFPRLNSKISEFDRCVGGGLVEASVTLIAGDPGIGKSTLLLQVADAFARNDATILYISGEESVNQVRLRAKRLGVKSGQIKLGSATNLSDIIQSITDISIKAKEENKSVVAIIDSVQTIFMEEVSSAPGTVSQVRACAAELVTVSKRLGVSLLMVSHVTKEGQIAGPKVLEHMVDTVLQFEGERDMNFRILRAVKNRFGASNEIGVFEMSESGLREISNPSELFITSYDRQTSGTATFAQVDGTRTILAEVQALIAPSFMPMPKRSSVGLDSNRLSMILAVLTSRFGLNFSSKEVYVNVVGGIKINDTSSDLAVCIALISAFRDVSVPELTLCVGEIGLTGEIRMIGSVESRIKEAAKLGFKKCVIPSANLKTKSGKKLESLVPEIEIIAISHIREVVKVLGG